MTKQMMFTSSIRRKYFQTRHVHRASLLVNAYLPVESRMRGTPAMKLKIMRVAKEMAKELNPPPLKNRYKD